jgi:hypothetical protein
VSIGLSSSELTDMRTAINDLLPGTGDIYSIANTPDGFGGYTEGTSIVTGGSNVPYRLDPLRGSEQIAGGAANQYFQYQLTIPDSYGTCLAPQAGTNAYGIYRFKAGTTYYRIREIDNRNDDKSWSCSTRVILERP